jgi:predicted MFS family arabinose efflux permease
MGFYQSMYGVGVLAGPLISGLVADGPGLDSVFFVSAVVAAGAALLALATRMPSTTS